MYSGATELTEIFSAAHFFVGNRFEGTASREVVHTVYRGCIPQFKWHASFTADAGWLLM
jgi:hypothetical protein